MASPDEFNAEHLKYEMVEVASMRRGGDFLVTGMNPAMTADESAQLVNLMAIYTVPGIEEPRLKRLDLPRPDLSPGVVETLVRRYAEEEGEGVPALHNEVARSVADAVEASFTEIEETETSLPPFRMLGMLGIFTSDGEKPLPIKYLNIQFLMTLMSHMPGAINSREMPEESLQQIYSSITEHTDKPSFEEWKLNFQGLTAKVLEEIGDMRVARAMAAMHLILVPEEVSHPTIESKLF